MAQSNVTYQKVSIKYGIFVGIAHIVYFLLMRILGLQDVIELSFLSAVFLIIGIIVAIANYKKALKGHINYLKGLAIGATVGVVSSSLLAIFMVVYISIFDSAYLDYLQASYLFPQSLTILSLFVLAIIYGTWPGFLIAFIAMQWFKEADHTMTKHV